MRARFQSAMSADSEKICDRFTDFPASGPILQPKRTYPFAKWRTLKVNLLGKKGRLMKRRSTFLYHSGRNIPAFLTKLIQSTKTKTNGTLLGNNFNIVALTLCLLSGKIRPALSTVPSTPCEVITFNGQEQLCPLTCARRRDLSNYTRMSTIQSRKLEKRPKKPCNIDLKVSMKSLLQLSKFCFLRMPELCKRLFCT